MTPSAKRALAVLVAVEHYPEFGSAADLSGPASEACDIARWLVDCGVPGDAITAHISALPKHRAEVERQRDLLGFTLTDAKEDTVFNHFDRRLPGGSGDALVVYWSGHGFCDPAGRTRLYYADSSYGRHTAMDVDGLIWRLGDPAIDYPHQYVIVDACREYSADPDQLRDLPPTVDRDFTPTPGQASGLRSAHLFAAPRGGRTWLRAGRKRSWFTENLLELLTRDGPMWPPDLGRARSSLNARADDGHPGGALRYQSPDGEPWERRLPGPPPARRPGLSDGQRLALAGWLSKIAPMADAARWYRDLAVELARRYPTLMRRALAAAGADLDGYLIANELSTARDGLTEMSRVVHEHRGLFAYGEDLVVDEFAVWLDGQTEAR